MNRNKLRIPVSLAYICYKFQTSCTPYHICSQHNLSTIYNEWTAKTTSELLSYWAAELSPLSFRSLKQLLLLISKSWLKDQIMVCTGGKHNQQAHFLSNVISTYVGCTCTCVNRVGRPLVWAANFFHAHFLFQFANYRWLCHGGKHDETCWSKYSRSGHNNYISSGSSPRLW